MTMYCRAAALLIAFTALFTDALAAQSDRSRSRSGPIRSVPVGADIKRDLDFDCPEEFGYYPHPTDCTLYYVCVFGGALLESCTGGLMYSHELQTCDWPRNVGCDATSGAGVERLIEVERLSERESSPAPPPPRRAPPPPPPRVQPNPVVTSRGQPKLSREEYVKQQQLYAEVEAELPPIEEIESDRQQRVHRGQPSTIGQVLRDRDGYSSQSNPGRSLNSNIIPASFNQGNSKIGSFSFGTQVDERRTASVTQAPQTYSENTSDVTDNQNDRRYILTNEIIDSDIEKHSHIRMKRDLSDKNITMTDHILTNINSTLDTISDKSDFYTDYEDEDINTDESVVEDSDNYESDRGKRQVRHGRHFSNNRYKNIGIKNWSSPKPIKLYDIFSNPSQSGYNNKYQPTFNSINFQDITLKPTLSGNIYTTTNPFLQYPTKETLISYQTEPTLYKPFKPSLPDPYSIRPQHNPINSATHIITKSPPISSLTKNENPFSALAGGFFNNAPKSNENHQFISTVNNPLIQNYDSSHLPSSVVTDKPVLIQTSPRTKTKYRLSPSPVRNENGQSENGQKNLENISLLKQSQPNSNNYKGNNNNDQKSSEESNDSNSSEDESDEDSEENGEYFNKHKHDFPDPPYEFTHPSNRYKEIHNPFADPNFDFDTFLSKLRNDHSSINGASTGKPNKQSAQIKNYEVSIKPNVSKDNFPSTVKSTTLSYKGMSTPRPFTLPNGAIVSWPAIQNVENNPSTTSPNTTTYYQQMLLHRPLHQQDQHHQLDQHHQQNQHQHQVLNFQKQTLDVFNKVPQLNAGTPLSAIRPKLKPPNFKDDRQLPINHNFNGNLGDFNKPTNEKNNVKSIDETKISLSTVTPKTYVLVTGKNTPIFFTTPKPTFAYSQKGVTLQSHGLTGRPYLYSTVKPYNADIIIKQTTPKPVLINQQNPFKFLQKSRLHPLTGSKNPTPVPNKLSEIPNIESIFSQTYRPNVNYSNIATTNKDVMETNTIRHTSTTTPKPKRRPIPKPSPEMNDYYYDDDEDEQYYYEPAVKPKYMPSSEVRPQRPPIAQNYEEYEDDDSYEDDDVPANYNKPQSVSNKRPSVHNNYKAEAVTKNHNDVSVVTKAPFKELIKNNVNGKIPVPVMIDTMRPNVLMRPEITNYDVVHSHRNRTVNLRRPIKRPFDNGPNTLRPPKYLNQTTLRPYTVRHRLAKPTTIKMPLQKDDNKQIRGRLRPNNSLTRLKSTTPSDNHNQETRYTKTRHDDRTNSLEPTESVTPVSYSASPRPKMLYNGSQTYNPEQFDAYYLYDEDGEVYKDSDYVQQYNIASIRPSVQQTYRGTPPPARRPVDTYSPRPISDEDYDVDLIQSQINKQNQYQTPIRQSTRGEGNELGYDHIPSSVRTTLYEATSISTTPSTTTSTSTTTTTTTTTTQRPTTAPYTEAMTPSRHTPRSSTDESHRPTLSPAESDSKFPSISTSSSPIALLNISSLAKPFEKTNNSLRFRQTDLFKRPFSKHSYEITKPEGYNTVSNKQDNKNTKKQVVSLTTGFSIRRNLNNSHNPYTLTVISRPYDNFNVSRRNEDNIKTEKEQGTNFYYDTENKQDDSHEKSVRSHKNIINFPSRKSDSIEEYYTSDEDTPIIIKKPKTSTVKDTFNQQTITSPANITGPKYYLKTVIKRPAPFALSNENPQGSTENSIETDVLIEKALENVKSQEFYDKTTSGEYLDKAEQHETELAKTWIEPVVSPYRTLNNLRKNSNENTHKNSNNLDYFATPQRSSLRNLDMSTNKELIINSQNEIYTTNQPSYRDYRIISEDKIEPTTEIFGGAAKQILKAFFNNFVPPTTPQYHNNHQRLHTDSLKSNPTTTEKTVNIGFHKKFLKYDEPTSLPKNVKRLQIVSDPTSDTLPQKYEDQFTESLNTLISTYAPSTTNSYIENEIKNTTPLNKMEIDEISDREKSHKFHQIISQSVPTQKDEGDNEKYNKINNDSIGLTNMNYSPSNITYLKRQETDKDTNDVTTTSTQPTTVKNVSSTSTKNYSPFPTRASRVNPAIKLAAKNLGGGRRSYQSPSKCSTDDSLQANPKCNEIKYQRPTPTRGRGTAHFSTISGGDVPQPPQTANRGTPPTRSRPTLKPSTVIVSKATESIDIYTNPPRRPPPVYPQPTPDKTAAKCRKDVCLLPDCYCGGKDIPGEMPMENVPQLVLLTFDDSVNDLNKVLYADLFEKGRVNPNGCPISATFYVSHEWTDYSQVQNLYAAGHEMASHTISHSFGEQFSQKKWNKEVGGQREILSAYGGVKLEDVRGMRAPFLSVGGNKMFKMLYDSNFTYDSSMPVYENRPPSWPYTLDYKLFHDCMIPPCPTKSYPGVWEVPMVMWQDLNGGRCSMGDACANPPAADGVYKMLLKNFDRHYTTNRAPFGLFYHAAWFTQPHHKEGFIMFLDFINSMSDVWIVTNWQALQWVRDPTPMSRLNSFQPFQCNYPDRPKKCNNPKVCNLWHKSGVRYMRTCQPCPEVYPWTGKTGIRSSRIDNEIEE